MASDMVSRRIGAVGAAMAPFTRVLGESAYARRDASDPRVCDFVFGNPNDGALPDFVAALQRWSAPQRSDWYAYTMGAAPARAAAAAGLRAAHGLPYADEDVVLTNGAFAGLAVVLAATLDPGDEVIFLTPAWFFYEAQIVAAGGRPVAVPVDPDTFDIDVGAVAAAIGERTRAVIVNTPHNPTGRIYPPETLERLSGVLSAASERSGRPVALISDEAYRRIVFDGRVAHSPSRYYANTFVVYTYGKTLLTPGQRMGYVALPPAMPGRAEVRAALEAAQIVTGFAHPNALLQHAWPDLERLSIDVAQVQRRRDRLAGELRAIGYRVSMPEGTFYLVARSPLADDWAFAELLAERGVYVLPGCVTGLPGMFRISLTASDAMVERAIDGFRAAWQRA